MNKSSGFYVAPIFLSDNYNGQDWMGRSIWKYFEFRTSDMVAIGFQVFVPTQKKKSLIFHNFAGQDPGGVVCYLLSRALKMTLYLSDLSHWYFYVYLALFWPRCYHFIWESCPATLALSVIVSINKAFLLRQSYSFWLDGHSLLSTLL